MLPKFGENVATLMQNWILKFHEKATTISIIMEFSQIIFKLYQSF